jgi:nitroreductase
MTFLELAARRCSIRKFRPDPVEQEKLEQVLEAARLAPSACNLQPWTFVVLRDESRRRELSAAFPRDWLSKAPVIVAACCDTKAAWTRHQDGKRHGDVDLAIAVEHMALAAAELGLGCCWVCAFDPAVARKALGLPEGIEPVVLLPLGYPAEEGAPKKRKPLSEIVRWERY